MTLAGINHTGWSCLSTSCRMFHVLSPIKSADVAPQDHICYGSGEVFGSIHYPSRCLRAKAKAPTGARQPYDLRSSLARIESGSQHLITYSSSIPHRSLIPKSFPTCSRLILNPIHPPTLGCKYVQDPTTRTWYAKSPTHDPAIWGFTSGRRRAP